jgi:hypothetical protein
MPWQDTNIMCSCSQLALMTEEDEYVSHGDVKGCL